MIFIQCGIYKKNDNGSGINIPDIPIPFNHEGEKSVGYTTLLEQFTKESIGFLAQQGEQAL